MLSDLSLEGKTLLVTGAGRNIGRAVALEFAAQGANVVINVRNNRSEAERVAQEVESLGAKSIIVYGDVSEKHIVDELKAKSEAAFSHVNMYVSCAARRLHKDFFELTHEEWHYYLNQQLSASWYLAKAFAPAMCDRRWGRIIHINGPDGWTGGWTRIPHSTAKGGLRSLTKSLASGLGRFGITVNDVNPGYTDSTRDPETHPETTAQREREMAESVPIRRQTKLQEVAWACLVLCSDRSSAITGSVIHVDGGQHMLG